MGDIADMMLDGTLCQECGDYLGPECGYPRSCSGCDSSPKTSKPPKQKSGGTPKSEPRANCPQCGKRISIVGLADHERSVHGGPSKRSAQCPICKKWVKPAGLQDHARSVHGVEHNEFPAALMAAKDHA
jgi:hypothetical protein